MTIKSQKKIYIIGIGGIGVSGIARYYNENGYNVFGSDKTNSELIEKLKSEGINIIIGEDENRLENFFLPSHSGRGIEGEGLIIYTQAIPENQSELKKALELKIKTLPYPKALANIANQKKLIAISGTHGKSTTSSLISIMMKNSKLGVNSLVGTILKEFDEKNTYFSNSDYFVIEACEYKRSFLRYKPYIGIITNIEIDHLDYYKDLGDYKSAFLEFINNIISGGYVILNGECENSMSLLNKRDDINYIVVYKDRFEITKPSNPSPLTPLPGGRGGKGPYYKENVLFPTINMQVPGEHILFDAKITYSVGIILGLQNREIINSLEKYSGVWRRSEIVGYTINNNLIISDYGHHPTEIKLTIKAFKDKYLNKKILVVFQPHQYSRTLELLEDFKTSFLDADTLIIPNIYESRDSIEDKIKINGEKFVNYISHNHKIYGNGLSKTLNIIKQFDNENNDLIIILLGAGDVDDLRYDLLYKNK